MIYLCHKSGNWGTSEKKRTCLLNLRIVVALSQYLCNELLHHAPSTMPHPLSPPVADLSPMIPCNKNPLRPEGFVQMVSLPQKPSPQRSAWTDLLNLQTRAHHIVPHAAVARPTRPTPPHTTPFYIAWLGPVPHVSGSIAQARHTTPRCATPHCTMARPTHLLGRLLTQHMRASHLWYVM